MTSSYKFYATPEDFEKVLEFVYSSGYKVHQNKSAFGERIIQFEGTNEVIEHYWESVFPRHLHLVLWHPNMNCKPKISRVDAVNNIQYYLIEGWGVMQLELGLTNSLSKYIRPCHFGHNSEKRAFKWQATYFDSFGSVSKWDWKEIRSLSNKFRYFVSKKVAVRKINKYGVLACAAELEDEGYGFSWN